MEFKNSKTANRRRYKSRYHSPHNYKTQRSKSENRAAILVAIATFLVIASLVLIFTFGDSIYTFFDGMLHPPVAPTSAATQAPTEDPSAATEPPTMAPTEAPTAPPTEAPTDAPVKQDAAFDALIAKAGIDLSSIPGSQMILVETAGTSATVYTYEMGDDGVWSQKFAPVSGFIGEDGASSYCVPDDHATPLGTYNIEYAIGVNDDPGTPLKYHQIEYGMRWVTDPASINYNRMVDGDATYIDFESCQWLHEYTVSYPYAVVFDYNRDPVDSSQGCAKFLHVSSGPTRGGVGISEGELYDILRWLDPGYAPTISIF
jgi:L,D-peptidoglycan transpeptidase YkuD (ErfK/YbiS/YcfS/YnhG family)